ECLAPAAHERAPRDTERARHAREAARFRRSQREVARRSTSAVGSLLGTAVGEAMGLPYAALSKRRAARLLGEPDRFRFVFGRGMTSGNTVQGCVAAQSLIA